MAHPVPDRSCRTLASRPRARLALIADRDMHGRLLVQSAVRCRAPARRTTPRRVRPAASRRSPMPSRATRTTRRPTTRAGCCWRRAASPRRRWPISTRPSASTPITATPTPIARWSIARPNGSIWRWPTTIARSRSMPVMRPAYLGRGLIYKARNQQTEALDDITRAISLRPDNAEALLQPRPALSGRQAA